MIILIQSILNGIHYNDWNPIHYTTEWHSEYG